MACVLSKGRKLPCKSAFGGIKAVYFADFGEITAITITENTGEIALTASGIEWYKYDVKGNSSLETTVTSSRENGTTFYTQTVNLTLTFLDALTQAQLQKVAVARPYVAVEDYYGNTFLCGYENGMEFTGGCDKAFDIASTNPSAVDMAAAIPPAKTSPEITNGSPATSGVANTTTSPLMNHSFS